MLFSSKLTVFVQTLKIYYVNKTVLIFLIFRFVESFYFFYNFVSLKKIVLIQFFLFAKEDIVHQEA
jgi:hypothetical protein